MFLTSPQLDPPLATRIPFPTARRRVSVRDAAGFAPPRTPPSARTASTYFLAFRQHTSSSARARPRELPVKRVPKHWINLQAADHAFPPVTEAPTKSSFTSLATASKVGIGRGPPAWRDCATQSFRKYWLFFPGSHVNDMGLSHGNTSAQMRRPAKYSHA